MKLSVFQFVKIWIKTKIAIYKSAGLQMCPRRGEVMSRDWTRPGADPDQPDWWDVMPNGDRTCSYCGSIHPDDFFDKVVEAARPDGNVNIEPSDKRYKIYISHYGRRDSKEGGFKFYTPHIPGKTYENRINRIYCEAVVMSARRFRVWLDNNTNQIMKKYLRKNNGIEPERF